MHYVSYRSSIAEPSSLSLNQTLLDRHQSAWRHYQREILVVCPKTRAKGQVDLSSLDNAKSGLNQEFAQRRH